jgi:hypothetical protein
MEGAFDPFLKLEKKTCITNRMDWARKFIKRTHDGGYSYHRIDYQQQTDVDPRLGAVHCGFHGVRAASLFTFTDPLVLALIV